MMIVLFVFFFLIICNFIQIERTKKQEDNLPYKQALRAEAECLS